MKYSETSFRVAVCHWVAAIGFCFVSVSTAGAYDAQEQADATDSLVEQGEEVEGGAAGSNPLASVSKIDLISTFTKDGGDETGDFAVEGGVMVLPRLKFVYELHYVVTDVTGDTENDWKSLHLKPIFFPKDVVLSEDWGMRIATGFEWILDFGNQDKGIGPDSDQIAPLLGLAFMNRSTGLAIIPLMQHFESYDNGSVSQTAFRLIGLKPLPNRFWAKLDAKIVRDWEDKKWPVDSEFELGRMLTSNIGVFAQALIGVGGDRPYDWGTAGAVRVNF